MLNINSFMIGTMRTNEMFAFYEKVFGKKPDMVEGDWAGWHMGCCFIGIGKHSGMAGDAKDPGRIMFNIETKDVKGEFERIKKMGAKVYKEPYQMGPAWICTFFDPDNNMFQLMSPWKSE